MRFLYVTRGVKPNVLDVATPCAYCTGVIDKTYVRCLDTRVTYCSYYCFSTHCAETELAITYR